VLDCVYPLARDHLSFPELLPEHEPHKVREVYLIQWEQPQLVVDITDTMDLKLRAARCHASQVAFTDFEARMRNRAATLGAAQGYRTPKGSIA
jgi:LmbE family N-acetylglucosaminyl deacetylase